MRKTMMLLSALIAGACMVAVSAGRPPAAAANAQTERGKYLVESVGMCGECHSPRNSVGDLDHSRWLEGAPMWFTPNVTPRDWAYRAPGIAGLPAFSDADMSMILEKGLQPTGRPIRPPMHIYHMSHDDAMAVVAYLRSLPPATNH